MLAALGSDDEGEEHVQIWPLDTLLAHSSPSPMRLEQLAAHALYVEGDRKKLEKLLREKRCPELLRRVALRWHPRSLAPLHAIDE